METAKGCEFPLFLPLRSVFSSAGCLPDSLRQKPKSPWLSSSPSPASPLQWQMCPVNFIFSHLSHCLGHLTPTSPGETHFPLLVFPVTGWDRALEEIKVLLKKSARIHGYWSGSLHRGDQQTQKPVGPMWGLIKSILNWRCVWGWASHIKKVLYCSLHSVAMIKHGPKLTWGGKGSFHPTLYNPPSRDA